MRHHQGTADDCTVMSVLLSRMRSDSPSLLVVSNESEKALRGLSGHGTTPSAPPHNLLVDCGNETMCGQPPAAHMAKLWIDERLTCMPLAPMRARCA